MTTRYSTHFRLPIPDFRSSPWHEQLQAAIQAIDNLTYRALVAGNTDLWANSTAMSIGHIRVDPLLGSLWLCQVAHTSPASPTTFAQSRASNPTYWVSFAINFNARGEWANETTYAYYDLAYDPNLGIIGLCTTAHTSSASPATIITDQANWGIIANFQTEFGADDIVFDDNPTDIVATNVQEAIEALDTLVAAVPAAITAAQTAAVATVRGDAAAGYDTLGEIEDLIIALTAAKAALASPTFTGEPIAPTPAVTDDSTKLATTAFVRDAIAVYSYPRSFMDGFTFANGTDATNDLNVSDGVCLDSTNAVALIGVSRGGMQLDADWNPGGNGIRKAAGGQAWSDGSWHMFIAGKADLTTTYYAHTGADVAAMLISLNAEANKTGADYIYGRRLWSFKRATSIWSFEQISDWCILKDRPLALSVTQTTTSALRDVGTPTGIITHAYANVYSLVTGAASRALLIGAPQATDANPSYTVSPLAINGGTTSINTGSVTSHGSFSQHDELTNTSAEWRFDCDSSTSLYLALTRYRDFRGKDGMV